MRWPRSSAVGVMALGLLLACGGGGGGGGSTAPVPSTGVLVDGPVAGLPYRTASQSGLTGAGGQFTYLPGETVTFSLGGLVLPAVAGAAVVDPMDIFGAETYNDARVLNLARLLLTLDENGDPADGLAIPEAARTAAAGIALTDWSLSGFDALVDSIVQAAGRTSLATAAAASSHLLGQSIVGTWYLESPPNAQVEFFTFLPDGTALYGVHAPDYASEPVSAGIQRADYTWDPATGALAIRNLDVNTAGSWGMDGLANGHDRVVWKVTGAETADVTMNGLPIPATAKRIVSSASPLAGTWLLRPVGKDLTLMALAILPGGHYASILLGKQDTEGGPGLDYGTYTFEPSTGTFVATPIADSTGGWGITVDALTQETAILTLNGSTLVNDEVPPDTMHRLEP